ncbi:MAG: hypothetical protein ACI957_004495, partial [Verrucomicrobiales bacterium]
KAPEEGPRPKDQYNFTDPESRIMKDGGSFEQCYNAQAAVEVEVETMLIVGAQVSDAVRRAKRGASYMVKVHMLGSPSDWLGLNQRIPKKSGSVRVVLVTDDQGVMGADSAQHLSGNHRPDLHQS